MKYFGIILLLAVASCQGTAEVARNKRAVSSALESLVEEFRQALISGSDDLGIPVLDPYTAESLDFNIESSGTALAGTLEDLTVKGLSGFVTNTLSFTVIGIRFTYCFAWESITVNTTYTIDGIIASLIPIYGSGDAAIELSNLNVCGALQLASSGGYLYVRSSTVDITLGGFAAAISGFLNDDDVSDLLSAVINDVAVDVFGIFSSEINEKANELLTTMANEVLGTMSLSDLISLIT